MMTKSPRMIRKHYERTDRAVAAMLDALNRLDLVIAGGGTEDSLQSCREVMRTECDRLIREARRFREAYERMTCVMLP